MKKLEDQNKVSKQPSWSTGNDGNMRACTGIWEASQTCLLMCDYDRELMGNLWNGSASGSYSESRAAAGHQCQQSGRTGHEAWVSEDTLAPSRPINHNDLQSQVTPASLLPSTTSCKILVLVNSVRKWVLESVVLAFPIYSGKKKSPAFWVQISLKH